MRRFRGFFALLLFIPLIAVGRGGGDILGLFPEEVSGNWKKDGESFLYVGDNLFEYINGGAEIYHEYGFERAAVQEYIGPRSLSVSVEIFEMKNAPAAFGIYSFKVSPDDVKVDLGDGGQMAGYYLNFWKGPYVVTLTGFDDNSETRRGLLRLAEAVDAKIRAEGEKPGLVSLLPREGLKNKDVRFFEGFLGLYNSRSFFSRDEFRFSRGVRGDYEDGSSLFIFAYNGEKEARLRFAGLRKAFSASSKYEGFKNIDKSLFHAVETETGDRIYTARIENFICLAAGKTGRDRARKLFTAVRREVEKPPLKSGP